jgi:hypothetical protein
MKSVFNRSSVSRTGSRSGLVIVTLALMLGLSVRATMLDDFNSATRSGWTDTLNSGAVTQGGGLLTIATANNNGALTYTRKTAVGITNDTGHTLELRVDVSTVSPANGDPNPLAILAWVPNGGAVLGSGYSLSVGAQDVKIQKGATVLHAVNYASAGTNIQNTNITLVLRLTPSGNTVSVNARVYRRIANGVIAQYFTAFFDYTVVDSANLIGTGGNAALGVKNQNSTTGSTVAFDNLQLFDTVSSVLDDFDSDLSASKWTIFRKNPGLGDSVSVHDGQLDVQATIADDSGGFAGVYSSERTFKIVDGGRVEFQLDIINNIGMSGSYSALGYLPVASPQYIYGIVSYHVANDAIGHTVVVNGKGYNEWWGGRNDIQPPYLPPGCRYRLTMTGEGSNCRIESRIEDLSVADINDPTRVVWQTEFVDTPAADAGLNESSMANPFPYLNFDGRFIITTFNSGALPPTAPTWAEILYDNAVVTQTLPPKSAPVLANVAPAYGANFLPANTTVSFDATDATNIPLNNLVVILNGVRYTNGSPGVTITPASSSSTSRHFTLANGLTANLNYVGSVQATNDFGLTSTAPLIFDTFLTNDLVVEAEEYNFAGGVYIDNPLLIMEQSNDPMAYNGQTGMAEVDYHDNRGSAWFGGYDANHTFRTADPVYTTHSSDPARAKYVNAGGQAAGFYEHEIQDIYDGDWVNYTHTYPSGTYNIFLRQATFKLLDSLVTLERVTTDPTLPDQATAVLGSFTATPTGIGLFANVPLTDGPGNPVVLRFSGGVETLRLMNRVTGNADLDTGNLEQNYLVFVSVADPGTLRPLVTMVSPAVNSTLNSVVPVTTASIANRDTSVNANSIQLQINGHTVTAAITTTAVGAELAYTLTHPLPPANSLVTNTLIYQDTAGLSQTNTWTWTLTYPYLRASSSLPLGSLTVRGFESRMVQTDNGNVTLDNTLVRAEQQLAVPPLIPYERTATSVVQVLNWNKTSEPPNNVPGLCAGPFINIAVESFAYLQLTAGAHRFHIITDDRAGLYSGANFRDPNATVLWENPGNTANATFDFVVEADGLYPVRCLWEETGGGASLALYSTNQTGGGEVLLNDTTDPAGVVKAWYPLVCLSSDSVTGPYTVETTATNAVTFAEVIGRDCSVAVNQTVVGGTFTLPTPSTSRFYLLDATRATKITHINQVGSTVVITYQVE